MKRVHVVAVVIIFLVSALFTYYDHLPLPSGLAFHVEAAIPWFFLVPTALAKIVETGGPHSPGSPEGYLAGLFLQLLVLYVVVLVVMRWLKIKTEGDSKLR